MGTTAGQLLQRRFSLTLHTLKCSLSRYVCLAPPLTTSNCPRISVCLCLDLCALTLYTRVGETAVRKKLLEAGVGQVHTGNIIQIAEELFPLSVDTPTRNQLNQMRLEGRPPWNEYLNPSPFWKQPDSLKNSATKAPPTTSANSQSKQFDFTFPNVHAEAAPTSPGGSINASGESPSACVSIVYM